MENNVVMQLFVQRHMPDGRSLTVPCTIEVLSEKDEKFSIELHNEVALGLSRDIFAASTEEELRRFLTEDGIAVGARYDGRLVCLRTLKISPDWVRESLADYSLSPERYEHSAVTGFCVVDREFRGNNIQFLSIEWTYGGYLRFVLKKEFHPKDPLWTHGHLRIPIRDIKRQKEALSNGSVGYKIVRGPSGFAILYGRIGP